MTEHNKDFAVEQKAPLVSHLIELRTRLIRTVIFLIASIGMCFYYSDLIFLSLILPLKIAMGETVKVSYFAPHEAFFVYMNLSLYSGLIISIPLILHQIWRFVVPGLYYSEQRAIRPFLFLSPMMFLIGGLFAYWVVLPMALSFFAGFQSSTLDQSVQIVQEIRLQDYAHFALTFILVFGLAFQLPVVLILLGFLRILTAQTLKDFRKYALLINACASAILTPPDLLSMLALAIPLQVMYEISILVIQLSEKKADVQKNKTENQTLSS